MTTPVPKVIWDVPGDFRGWTVIRVTVLKDTYPRVVSVWLSKAGYENARVERIGSQLDVFQENGNQVIREKPVA